VVGDDLSRIARTEMELLEVTLKRLIEVQTDKIVGMLFLLVALSYGSLFLLGGIVLLIHLWLAWWLAFLITGVAIVTVGIFFQMRMKAAPERKACDEVFDETGVTDQPRRCAGDPFSILALVDG
jgi:hypothetical protein